jgi:hypothetical protein
MLAEQGGGGPDLVGADFLGYRLEGKLLLLLGLQDQLGCFFADRLAPFLGFKGL